MKNAFRILLLICCALIILWAGLMRESKLLIVRDAVPVLINKYPKPPASDHKSQLQGLFSFNLSPKLQSSILFGFLFMILASAIVGLLSKSKKLTKLTALLYIGLLGLCFILLQLGTLGVDYRLSTGLSHYLEDIIVSPFMIMLLIVLLKLNGSIKM